ncbi:hypothetical protein Cabys_2588 [Caldithrix abyssi DSM 13497]|uniref:Uncharacterized protein n=1 Tax=Caldithrix abyssi DSM 13497 TaxID=880073 RepID=A0A1J1CAN1_CALAY|nr:hypothetical protein Cabys_2588 [Caldithrix abyssi DSM 13497]
MFQQQFKYNLMKKIIITNSIFHFFSQYRKILLRGGDGGLVE